LVRPPNRILVWQSQLSANDFPPICAMTGAPAETWRRLTITKYPPWAFWVGGILLANALSERITGHLPLTRASVTRIRIAKWLFGGLIPLAFVLWLIGIVVLSTNSTSEVNTAIFYFCFLLGFGALFGGMIGFILGRAAVGPTGRIMRSQPGQPEYLIEIRNVHPSFVSAVQQLQQSRAGNSK
jgi:hypothetical protein